MNTNELCALYDRQERYGASFPGIERIETARTVRMVDTTGGRSFLLYSDLRGLTGSALDALIEEEISFFRGRGLDFEWKAYRHDAPPGLKDRLAMHGASVEETEALLVRDLAGAPPRLFDPHGHSVERITEPGAIDAVVHVEQKVWGTDERGLGDRLRREIAETPDATSVFVARIGGQPVGAAWVTYTTGSDFASLWGGSVLPEYRGQGIYGALLAARAQDARQRGRRFLMIDAGPMSKPIVESLGFLQISESNPCVFSRSVV
jgi:GNAT superfamily N-acetyltransferase